MNSGKDWLPVPVWLVILMFVVGVGAGGVLGYVISSRQPADVPAAKPWQDKRAAKAAQPAPSPVKTDADTLETGTKSDPPATAKPIKVAPLKTDVRYIENMPRGPVVRAINTALGKIRPKIHSCLKKHNTSEEVVVRFEFEVIGGMATVTGSEVYNVDQQRANQLQSCMLKTMATLLIDFPVENGEYEVLTNERSPNEAEKTQAKQPQQK